MLSIEACSVRRYVLSLMFHELAWLTTGRAVAGEVGLVMFRLLECCLRVAGGRMRSVTMQPQCGLVRSKPKKVLSDMQFARLIRLRAGCESKRLQQKGTRADTCAVVLHLLNPR